MITALLGLILFAIIAAYLVNFAFEKPSKNYPPGPPKIPYFGSYFFMLMKDYLWSAKVCSYWSKLYKSDIVGFYFGPFPVISLNSYESIKAFFNTPEFDGRLDIFVARHRSLGERFGIFFNDGPEWHVQKRFSLRYLRDFGFGRRCPDLEGIIELEIKRMLEICSNGPQNPGDELIAKKGGIVKLPDLFLVPLVYPMLTVITGRTFTKEMDNLIRKASKEALYLLRSIDDLGGFLTLTPWLRHISSYLTGFSWFDRGNKAVYNLAKAMMKEAFETKDPDDDHIRNFIDLYANRIKEEKESTGSDTPFSEGQLSLILSDFLFPTMSGNGQSLLFALKQAISSPEIQIKCQEEIDNAVGRGRLPNLDDRQNLPYNEAFMREALRRWTLVHLALPHRSVKDTKFMGYDIPANTAIIPNLLHLHMDERIWGDPQNFRPERFLDENGKMSLKKDLTFPFGAGRRLCSGETYSRNINFLVFTALLQNYTLSMADGSIPDIEKESIPGLFVTTTDIWVKLTPRI